MASARQIEYIKSLISKTKFAHGICKWEDVAFEMNAQGYAKFHNGFKAMEKLNNKEVDQVINFLKGVSDEGNVIEDK